VVFFYFDESYDEELLIFSAIAVPAGRWRPVFEALRERRRYLREEYGIFMRKELHAREFLAGKGRISDRVVFKGTRAVIFREQLRHLATLPVRIFNAAFPPGQKLRAFERLLNRINRTLQPDQWNSHGLLICDEGSEGEITKLCRKMAVYNPIPSRFGVWPTGEVAENIPLDRIIEDPVFKDSARSYLIQSVDFVAYALLRQERPIPRILRYGIETAFDEVEPVLFTGATRVDPRGIVRP